MCENVCRSFDTFNPEIEYKKFLSRKPIVQTLQLYEHLHARETVSGPRKFRVQLNIHKYVCNKYFLNTRISFRQVISKAMEWRETATTTTPCTELVTRSMDTIPQTPLRYPHAISHFLRSFQMNFIVVECTATFLSTRIWIELITNTLLNTQVGIP